VSGGERRRVSIGVDIIHGPSLLFLDEPTSSLDSTSAHNVTKKVHHIAHSGSTVILTIHQPSWRIQSLLDHLIILVRGQLMYQGSPKDVTRHLSRMGRKVPKGENSIEHLIDVIQEYDQSELGVEVLTEFARTGLKPPALAEEDLSLSVSTIAPSPTPLSPSRHQAGGSQEKGKSRKPQTNAYDDYDHNLRSPYNSRSLASSDRGVMQLLRLTPSRTSQKGPISRR
jgi:ABC-type multidrug transport system ATPase subunit